MGLILLWKIFSLAYAYSRFGHCWDGKCNYIGIEIILGDDQLLSAYFYDDQINDRVFV